MKINWSKVLLGGIVAAVVMLAIVLLTQKFWLGQSANAQLDAFKPGLSAAMMSGNAPIIYGVNELILGIALVWTYAAIRPRFGPGPKTAAIATIPLWIAMCVAYYGEIAMGMMTPSLWWTFSLVGLVAMIVGTMAGASFYSEGAAA